MLWRKLTSDIHTRDAQAEARRLITKWDQTGLLEGLQGGEKSNMAILLENQAKQVLKESTSMAAGDVEGYAQVAFPMVRRIFSRMIATKIVAVQPMSLPTGLIFFIDFTYNTDRLAYTSGESIYGGGRVGKQLTAGVLVNDTGTTRYGEKGFYGLNHGYSTATGSISGVRFTASAEPFEVGAWAGSGSLIRHDHDLLSGTYATVVTVGLNQSEWDSIAGAADVSVNLSAMGNSHGELDTTAYGDHAMSGATLVRRLTTVDEENRTISFVFNATASFGSLTDNAVTATVEFDRHDAFTTADALGAVVGTTPWELEIQDEIPEIDLKVDSIDVRAVEKKLKAKWSHEVGQDLQAYHNIDAESELTAMLSDHIEWEMNAEILAQLVVEASAGTYYWSRSPGQFVDWKSGEDRSNTTSPPDFTGNIWDWNQGLLELVNHLSAQIQTKILKGGANFIVTHPKVAVILQSTPGYAANISPDDEMGTAGTKKAGNLQHTFDVYVDPMFYQNLMLVGRKGSGFLENGFVHAPYIPLIVHPTILGVEDFVPRKAVMTRYANQMVWPDYYGLIAIANMEYQASTP